MTEPRECRMYMVNARLKKNLSMRKVAESIGVTHQHYSRIESGYSKGRISLKIMGLIAETLDIPLQDLYDSEMDYLRKVEGGKRDELSDY
ncbi:MAG: helix-turn-helix transcriptional regulator [Bacilli bacterium]|nr:helix-turn-helix transcriptional regulator [Bacilli bacterium]MBR0439672.1 helix-turn-helix transcriptional regulator [Bacilli bacterium]